MDEKSAKPDVPRRKIPILWVMLGVLLLLFVGFLFQLFGPDPPIQISKQTTYLTEPLGADGLPDYEAHWIDRERKGVTPDNNAAVLIWQAMWPGDLERKHWLPMCEALGMDAVPLESEALVGPYDGSVCEQVAQDLIKRFAAETGQSNPPVDYTEEEWQSYIQSIVAENLINEAISRPWTEEQLPALAAWVRDNQQPLGLLIEASKRPRYYSPSPSMLNSDDDSLVAMLLPDIGMLRTTARGLSARAMGHLGEGRVDDAWQDLLACHRLARLMAENDTLIGQIVAIAIDGIACSGTQILLHHGDLSLEQAKAIEQDLGSLGPVSDCVRALDIGERMWYLDSVIGLALGDDELLDHLGDGTEHISNLLSFARVDWNIVLRMGNEWYDRLVAAAKLPTRDQRVAELDRMDDELWQLTWSASSPSTVLGSLLSTKRRSEVVGGVIIEFFLPATSVAFDAEDRAATQLKLTRLAAALAVYRAEHGEYPEQLTDLVPNVLPKLPLDLYSGKPFIYSRKDDGGYLLYSVFENGIDDGGDDRSDRIIDGEWVEKRPEDFYYQESDLVIRVPVPALEMPEAPTEEELEYGGEFGGYGGPN